MTTIIDVTIDDEPVVLTLDSLGIQGPPGPPGPAGERGPAGDVLLSDGIAGAIETSDPDTQVRFSAAAPPSAGQTFIADGLGAGNWATPPDSTPPIAEGDDTDGASGLLVLGADSAGLAHVVQTDALGTLQVHDAGVSSIQAAVDAATAKLNEIKSQLAAFDTSDPAHNATILLVRDQAAAIVAKLSAALTVSGSVTVSNLPSTQAVSVAQLPTALDSGALKVSVANFPAQAAVQPVSGTVGISGTVMTRALTASDVVTAQVSFPSVQPISGSVTAGLQHGNTSTDPLYVQVTNPSASGGASEATLSALSDKVPTLTATSGSLHVTQDNVPTSINIGNFPAQQSVNVVTAPSTLAQDASVTAISTALGDGTQKTQVTALPSITGAVSVTNFPSSQPVTVSNFPTSQTVAGSVSVSNASLATTSTQLPSALVSGRLSVDGSGVTQPVSGSISISNFPGTQPVSGTVTISNAVALDATLTSGSQQAQLRSGSKGTSAGALVTSTSEGSNNQALDVQLYHGGTAKDPTQTRALTSADVVTVANPVSTVAVSSVGGTVATTLSGSPTVTIGNTSIAITAGALPLPSGASSETTLASRLADSTLTARLNTLGAKTSANSAPVVLATDQASIPVAATISGTVPISATALPLPSGAASETTLASRLADATFITRVNTLGAKTSAASTPVVLASDQASIPVAASIQGTPTVTIGNASLAVTGTVAVSSVAGTVATTLASTTITGTVNTRTLTASDTVTVGNSSIAVTSSALAQDATLTSGTQKAIARGGTKGATTSTADITSTAEGADHQALDVQLYHSGSAINPQQIRALTSADVVSVSGTVPISAASLPLPSGASTETTLGTRASESTLATRASESTLATRASESTLATMLTGSAWSARTNTLGQKAMAASMPVAIATDQASVPVAATIQGTPAVTLTSGTVTANIGTSGSLALDATLTGGSARSRLTDGTNLATVKAASTAPLVTDTALVVAQALPGTSTRTSTTASTTSTTLLSANTLRKGATITNESTATLYLGLGLNASTTNYSVQLPAAAYYEVPYGFVGPISGIWTSATGSARLTELT